MSRETPRNKDDKAQEHDQGIRDGGSVVQLTESAKGQLTESAGWMGDDDFSWC